MSEENITDVKHDILKMFLQLDPTELDIIENWISSQSYKKDLKKMEKINESEIYLKKIGESIKKIVPFQAEMPTENIFTPTIGDLSDCTKENTVHIDAFLYDEDQIEVLVKKGKVHRKYCIDCYSKNIKDFIFISHSMPRMALQYVFKVLLPADLDGKQILDVGSRIGAVIFSAYHLTNSSSIVGVEINKELCDIQETIRNQFSMDSNRIKIENSDIMKCQDIIQNSDIIILNILDFFVDIQKYKDIWYYFKQNIKKGSYIVTNRSIPETLGTLEIYDDFMNWLFICKPCQMENEILFTIEDFDNYDFHLYIVN